MPRLLRPRITLRVLLLLVAVIAAMLGWQIKQQRDVRRAIEAIEAKGGLVFRNTQMPNKSAPIQQPSWFAKLTGESDFDNVDSIALTSPEFTDDDARLLRLLPSLRQLTISGSSITDAGLKDIASLPSLAMLDVSDTPVTAVGLLQLGSCKTLRSVFISENQFGFSPPLGPTATTVQVLIVR